MHIIRRKIIKRIDQNKIVSNTPFFYGWVVVLVASLGMFFTGPGQTFSFSMFLEHFINDFGWTRTQVNSYYSIASFISGISMYFVGKIVDKQGAKKVMVVSGLILAFAMLWLSFLSSLFMLFIGYFLGRFSGQSSLTLASNAVAPKWFVKKRGQAIMITGLGVTISNMVLPKLNAYLIETFGWRTAFRILGALVLFVFIPICYIFIIDDPDEIGGHPDGISDSCKDKEHFKQVELDHDTSLDQGESVRTLVFWIMFFSSLQFSMINTGIGLNYISIYNESGITDLDFITSMMSLAPLIGIASTLLSGLYVNKLKKPNILLGIMSVAHAVAYVLLSRLDSIYVAVVYTVIMGFSVSIFQLLHNILKPYFFGRKFIGSVSGLFVIAVSAGSAFGPVLFGLSYDLLGGYTPVLLLCAVLSLIAGLSMIVVKKPKKRMMIL